MRINLVWLFLLSLILVFPAPIYAKKVNPVSVDSRSALAGLFVKAQTCTPIFSWEDFRNDTATETYDVAVYNALKSKGDVPDRGEQVFYIENLNSTQVQVQPPLQPDKKYFWSLRRHRTDGATATWLVHDPIHVTLLGAIMYKNMWFGVKTPNKCK